MSCVKRLAMQEPVVDTCDAEQICTSASCVLSIDLATVTLDDLAFSETLCKAVAPMLLPGWRVRLRPRFPRRRCVGQGGPSLRCDMQVQSFACQRRGTITCTPLSHTLIARSAYATSR